MRLLPQMLICLRCCLATTRRAHEKSLLYQKRFIHIFDGAGFFANSGGDGIQTHGSALEFFNNGKQNAVVHFIQTVFIHIQRAQGMFGNPHIDNAVAKHLGEITHTSK